MRHLVRDRPLTSRQLHLLVVPPARALGVDRLVIARVELADATTGECGSLRVDSRLSLP